MYLSHGCATCCASGIGVKYMFVYEILWRLYLYLYLTITEVMYLYLISMFVYLAQIHILWDIANSQIQLFTTTSSSNAHQILLRFIYIFMALKWSYFCYARTRRWLRRRLRRHVRRGPSLGGGRTSSRRWARIVETCSSLTSWRWVSYHVTSFSNIFYITSWMRSLANTSWHQKRIEE